MGDIGGYDMGTARGEVVFCSADGHVEFTCQEIRDLFVNVMVLGHDGALFYAPDGQGAGVAVDHFSKEAGHDLFGGYIVQVLHGSNFPEDN